MSTRTDRRRLPWLRADAREVVRLSGSGRSRGVECGPDIAAPAAVGEGLERWRRRVERRRRVAALRRAAIVAFAVAVVLAALVALDVLPLAVAIPVELPALAAAVVVALRRGESVAGAAHLLDGRLRLYDRLGTALEIERRGAEQTVLERRAVADAAALLAAGEGDWRADPAPAPHEWGALAALLVALALVIGVGAATQGSGGSATTAERGGGPGGGAAGEAGKQGGRQPKAPPAARQGEPNGQSPQRQENPPSSGFKQLPAPPGATPGTVRGGRAPGASGQAKGARGTAGGKGAGGAGRGGGEAGAPGQGSQPTRSEGASKGSPRGAAAPGDGPRSSAGSPRNGATPRAGNKPGNPATATQGQGTAKGGAPTGTPNAGGAPGSEKRGNAAPVEGRRTRNVKLQPGYAPLPAGRGGTGTRFGKSQGGGGRGRGGQVGGGTGGSGALAFVPASGGAVPGPAADLQRSYLTALAFVEGLPW